MNIIDDITDRSVFGDPDFRRDQLEAMFPCRTCGNPEPARLGSNLSGQRGCEACVSFDLCETHDRWTFIENGWRCPLC